MFRAVLLSVLALSGATLSRAADAPRKFSDVTIAQYGHVFLYLPVYVALAKGYFTEEGLHVHLVSTGGDEKTFAAVLSGYAQYGVADPLFTAIAREQGRGGKVIASLVNGVPFWGVTYRKDIPVIDDAPEFSGTRIAVYDEPSTNYAVMRETLNSAHVRDATIVQGSYGSLLAMLQAGKADIAMELEPNVSVAVANGARVVYSLPHRISHFAFTGLTTSDSQLAEHPAQARAVVRALAKGLSSIRNDPRGTLAIAEQEFPELPNSVVESALNRLVSDKVIPTSLFLYPSAWQNAVAVRRAIGELNGTAAYSDNVDMRFVDQKLLQ
jgi:NitT/TauT family transport system substrate-binding protein